MKLWSLGILMALVANVALAKEPITAAEIGVYGKEEKAQLAPAFIAAVNDYLHRYKPRLVKQEDDYVKMQVEYDMLFDVELKIKAEDYEIRVTLKQYTKSRGRRLKQAKHLANGIFKEMDLNLTRRSRRKA